MGLGIETNGIYKEYSIPLFSDQDKDWEDNTWITEHLRHLADKIEEDNIKIYEVRMDFDRQYKIPNLVIVTFVK